MSDFKLTNIQGVFSKSPLTQQAQDGIAKGHEFADQQASEQVKKDALKATETVNESNKPEEITDDKEEEKETLVAEEETEEDDDRSDEETDGDEPPISNHDGHIDIKA